MPQHKASCEQLLLDTLKWPIKTIQIIGYCVLTKFKNKTMVIEPWWSYSRLHPIVQLIIIWLTNAIYVFNYDRVTKYLPITGSVENMTVHLTGLISTIAANIYRLLGTIKPNPSNALNFWQGTCSLLEFLSKSGIDLQQEYSSLFQSCKTRGRNLFLLYFSFITFNSVGINFIYPILNYLLQNDAENFFEASSLMYFACSFFWALLLTVHVCHSIWPGSFLKIYHICFVIVHSELVKSLEFNVPAETLFTITNIAINGNGKKIENINEVGNNQEENKKIVQAVPSKKFEDKIMDCIKIYHKIEHQVQVFNDYFGTRIIFDVLYNIFYISTYLFIFATSINSTTTTSTSFNTMILLTSMFLFSLHLVSVYELGTGASRLTQEAHRIVGVLEELGLDSRINRNVELRLQIQGLISKILTCPPEPAPGMFFTLNRNLLTSVLSAITTYLVFLIQFRTTDLSSCNCTKVV